MKARRPKHMIDGIDLSLISLINGIERGVIEYLLISTYNVAAY